MLRALLLSVLAHALLAAVLALYLDWAPQPDVLPQLDRTSVELSFSEKPRETETVAPSMAQQATPYRPKPPEIPSPEREAVAESPVPPRFALPEAPRPAEVTETLETPKVQSEAVVEAAAVPAEAPRQAKVDAQPKAKRAIRPEYPREARQRGEEGNVTVRLEIDEKGLVTGARVVRSSGHALLDEAALKAVRAARFVPAKAGGRGVASRATLTLEFRLK